MNGQTQLVGILGWPVAHSKSPAMHNAAFNSLGLNWAYVPLSVDPNHSFGKALEGLSACGFRGANVTVPYKEVTVSLVDEISEEARIIGAVNTIVFKNDGTARGENTDARGFLAHLAEEKVDLQTKTVAVIGAGGAARAIVFALRQAGAGRLLIINRHRTRADDLAREYAAETLDWSRESFFKAAQAHIIVNTTSLGLHDGDDLPWHDEVRFSPSHIVYDAIYSKTPLLQRAIQDGARAISGVGMLLWQGALGFEIWTGIKAPIDVMKRELSNA